jgi:hypothetical protein
MRRPPTFALRVLRALTALVTVWCLGCSAFEPVVSRLAGETVDTGMVCAGEASESAGATIAASADRASSSAPMPAMPTAGAAHAEQPSALAVPTEHGARGYVCGCQSCHAPEPMLAAVPAPATPSPAAAPAAPRLLVSVVREPLVPPPQVAL